MAAGVRGSVIRRRTDGGIPLVLLRADATPADLATGVQVAAVSVAQRGGASPKKDVRMNFREGGVGTKRLGPAEVYLAELRNAPRREIDGIGSVRAMKILAPAWRAKAPPANR